MEPLFMAMAKTTQPNFTTTSVYNYDWSTTSFYIYDWSILAVNLMLPSSSIQSLKTMDGIVTVSFTFYSNCKFDFYRLLLEF